MRWAYPERTSKAQAKMQTETKIKTQTEAKTETPAEAKAETHTEPQKGWGSSTHIPVLCPILFYISSIQYRTPGINTFRPYQVLPGLPEPAP